VTSLSHKKMSSRTIACNSGAQYLHRDEPVDVTSTLGRSYDTTSAPAGGHVHPYASYIY